MNLKEQQDKEYRAQWIRETARDFMIAHLSVGAEKPYTRGRPPKPPLTSTYSLACSLWGKYEQERK